MTPEDYVADVIGDLKGRLGEVQRTEPRDNAQVIYALVPQANMSDYALNPARDDPEAEPTSLCNTDR